MRYLSIKQKLILGFSLVAGVILILSAFSIWDLNRIQKQMKNFVQVEQPLSIGAQDVNLLLQKSMNNLNLFLLTGNQVAVKKHQIEMAQVKAKLAALKFRLNKWPTASIQQQIQQIDKILQTLDKALPYIKQVSDLQLDRNKKFPVFAFVAKNLQPAAAQIQQQLNLMIGSELNDLSPERAVIVDTLVQMQKTWLNVMSSVRGYVAFRTEKMAKETELYLEQFDRSLNKLKGFADSDLELTIEEEDGVSQIEKAFKTYRENFKQAQKIHQGPKWRMDIWLMKTQVEPLFKQAENTLDKFAGEIRTQTLRGSQQTIQLADIGLELQWIFSISGILLAIILAQLIARSVVKPIEQAMNAMKDIAEGEGDLTQRLQAKGRDEVATMAHYFNQFVSKVQQVVAEVGNQVTHLEQSSDALLQATQSSSASVTNQLAATEELKHSMQKMAQQAKVVEGHASNTTKSTYEVVEKLQVSGQVARSSAEEIKKLSRSMEEISASVEKLSQDGETIGSVVNVIKEIAEQTNLLALNAAIEAARAGEHGRGFAVVADEVRGLAQRTQESTAQIEKIIENIFKATQKTVRDVEKGQEETEHSIQAVLHTEEVLLPIISLVEEVRKMNEQMRQAAQTQNQLVSGVNTQLEQIVEVSDEVAKSAEKTGKSGHILQTISQKLQKLIHQFKF
ncbi:methyl-accepting chemotaxis protein [Galenea microaerophila]